MRVICQVEVRASPDQVAEVLNAPEEAPKWQTGLSRMEVVRGGPNEVGSVARLDYSEGGRTFEMADELLECVPNRLWKSRVSGAGFSAMVETQLVETEAGTMVGFIWEGRPEALGARLLFPLMRRRVRKRIDADLAALRRLVEERVGRGGKRDPRAS